MIYFACNQVARWRNYLKPVLDQAETRNHFDIHKYGSTIINKVETISQKSHDVSFEDIVEVGETPRYFLSMLQLVKLLFFFCSFPYNVLH